MMYFCLSCFLVLVKPIFSLRTLDVSPSISNEDIQRQINKESQIFNLLVSKPKLVEAYQKLMEKSEEQSDIEGMTYNGNNHTDKIGRSNRYSTNLNEQNYHCRFQPNGYDCKNTGKFKYIFYYNYKMKACMTAKYGYCANAENIFNTLEDCATACRSNIDYHVDMNVPPEIYCQMQPDFGSCTHYQPHFYYDVSTKTCKGFAYSGCGGNLNRFTHKLKCVTTCLGAVKYTPPE